MSLEWAAGFYEGEGCITFNRHSIPKGYEHRPYYRISISVGQNNREPLEKFLTIFGFGHINGPYWDKRRPKSPPMYMYTVTGFNKALKMMTLFWPHLSQKRRKQALIALLKADEFREQPRLKPGPKIKGVQ